LLKRWLVSNGVFWTLQASIIVMAIVSFTCKAPLLFRFSGTILSSHEPKLGDCAELIGRPRYRSSTWPAQPLFFLSPLHTVTL
jgi:hypothetical protein